MDRLPVGVLLLEHNHGPAPTNSLPLTRLCNLTWNQNKTSDMCWDSEMAFKKLLENSPFAQTFEVDQYSMSFVLRTCIEKFSCALEPRI